MLTLGVDIGTTSVKIVLVKSDGDEFKVISSRSARHEADVTDPSMPTHSEQDVEKLWLTVETCMTALESDVPNTMQYIEMICICGQMHGCVLWDSSSTGEDSEFSRCTNLVTWRDQRCDIEFLSTLPDPEMSVPLSTGFGCATLFWLKRNQPEVLSKFNCCGTVMDYFVATLCNLKRPPISTQNAMSWGYYNFCTSQWNKKILRESGFPVEVLPDIIKAGEVAGMLDRRWHGIAAGARVLAALGDMQCSVLSCGPKICEGVFNLSTSAQLSTVSLLEAGENSYQTAKNPSYSKLPSSVICVPYFGSHCLWTSASLNGGAVLELLATALFQWTKKFAPSVTMAEIYEQLNADDSTPVSGLSISPTVFGERHCPDAQASVSGIGAAPISLPAFGQQLGHSIIQNVKNMFTKAGKNDHFPTPKRIWACGTAFRNTIFKSALQKVFDGAECRFDKEMDAAFGAAIVSHLIAELRL